LTWLAKDHVLQSFVRKIFRYRPIIRPTGPLLKTGEEREREREWW